MSQPSTHEVHISLQTDLPAEDYQIEILANDVTAGVNKFTVK